MRKDIFSRAERLLGSETMDNIASKRVILFGVGGVGSWCAEALVRSGISRLTIVDSDRVSVSNINRQLMATVDTVGQVKVDVLKERLLSINPDAEIVAKYDVFTKDTADSFRLEEYDYIIDCIDSLTDKANLILTATRMPGKFYSSMGAALKIDSSRIKVDEFWKVHGCPLARLLRKRFKKRKEFPAKKFLCVFSDELLENKGEVASIESTERTEPQNELTITSNKVQINGSLMHITGIYGLTIAGLVIRDCNKLTN